MKKKGLTLLVATTLASSVLFSSCIGSFGLTNKLLDSSLVDLHAGVSADQPRY